MSKNKTLQSSKLTGLEVAIIGYSARINNCENTAQYWKELFDGKETYQVFDEEELEELGVPEEVYQDEDYINVNGYLRNKDCFDARFFGYSPAEAKVMDPQIRIFHEIVWEGLEMAGYNTEKTKAKIGLYASASNNCLWQTLMILDKDNKMGAFATGNFADKDYLCSLIAYKLNLKGPAIFSHTACSSSLVAIHQAIRGILVGDCQMAVAGGVSCSMLKTGGYTYQENMIYSADGHCKAFDSEASGIVPGEGGGVVVLKKYKDALRDGDTIHAIIKGTAINNDGHDKIGFSAPSISGQRAVIQNALKIAKVDPNSISYIETHGTGTKLGDPVEFQALHQAYKQEQNRNTPIGSVKTNIGHLDTAAGVASVIKVVLMLRHKKIVPSLHFNNPNPNINFSDSPFYVNDKLIDWKSDYSKLRAGISSLGIGGNNVHLIIEEPDALVEKQEEKNGTYLINLSAPTDKKVKEISLNLAKYLEENKNLKLADIAYTLNCGRADFDKRKSISTSSVEGLIADLLNNTDQNIKTKDNSVEGNNCVFMFSGQGAQYVNMGKDLYEGIPYFKTQLDTCFELIEQHHNIPLSKILFQESEADTTKINETLYAQLSLFSISYSLAKLLIELGVKPTALIGHSIGEYAGAVISGMLELDSAIQIIGKRATLMQGVERGKMYAVFAKENTLQEFLAEDISIAAANSDDLTVVSGNRNAMEHFSKELETREIDFRVLKTSHAFHSSMMDGILDEYTSFLKKFSFSKGRIPLISNLSGQFFEKAPDANYWAKHLRQTVRFGDGIKSLLEKGHRNFIEIGPGKQLVKLLTRLTNRDKNVSGTNTIRTFQEETNDQLFLINAASKIWHQGKTINWNTLYGNQNNHRINLPVYPFKKVRFPLTLDWNGFVDRLNGTAQEPTAADNLTKYLFRPTWKERTLEVGDASYLSESKQVLIFCDENGYADKIMAEYPTATTSFIKVLAGSAYQKNSPENYTIDPTDGEGYSTLFNDLKDDQFNLSSIIHCWDLSDLSASYADLDRGLYQGYLSLSFIAKALSVNDYDQALNLSVLTTKCVKILAEEEVSPLKAMSIGALKVISVEYPNVKCKLIDVENALPVLEEIYTDDNNILVAYRGDKRYVPTIKKVRAKTPTESPLRQHACYLIPGGLGGMGFSIAYDLAAKEKAKLALITRRSFPPREAWEDFLSDAEQEPKAKEVIRKIKEMEGFGAEVMLLSADVSDSIQMKRVIAQVENKFGKIDGLIWAAGVIDYDGVIQRRTKDQLVQNLKSKVHGLLVLKQLMNFEQLDFVALFSSIGNVFYKKKFGQVAYNGANEFLDAYAQSSSIPGKILTINWCDWREVGMTVKALSSRNREVTEAEVDELIEDGLTPQEGVDVFRRCLEVSESNVVISKEDLVRNFISHRDDGIAVVEKNEDEIGEAIFERPELSTPYQAPESDLEIKLVNICCHLFGINKVGVNDDFLDLGGDSLIAIQFISQIKEELGVKISLEDFFSNPTIVAFAELISSKEGTSALSTDEVLKILPAEKSSDYQLSSAQKRMYFLFEFDKSSVAYNMPKIIKVNGKLEQNKFATAFQQLVKRHEIFRTSFHLINGEPVQKITDQVDFKIGYVKSNNRSDEQMMTDFIRPFDLTEESLLRVELVEKGAEEYLFMIDLPHIISDGLSHGILMQDFMALYNKETLPALKIQYKDFAEWQQNPDQENVLKADRDYWVNKFAEMPEVLELPTDYKRAEIKEHDGSSFEFKVNAEQTAKLKELSHQLGATMYMTVLAVYKVLLSKLGNVEDVIVGTPVGGRQLPELQNMIGMFVNTLPLRSFPKGTLTFKEYLSELKISTLGSFDHQSFQYEELIDELQISRDTGRNPLFDVMFVFENANEPEFKIEGLTFAPYTSVHNISKFDLTLSAVELDKELFLSFEYSTGLFKAETIKKFGDYFKKIVLEVAANPEIAIKEINVLSNKEESYLLNVLDYSKIDYPKSKTAVDLFREQVNRTPDNIALTFKGQQMSYRELDEKSSRLGALLIGEGIGANDVVGLFVERSMETVIGMLGILKAGGAYVPIDVTYPQERIDYILQDSATELVLTKRKWKIKLNSDIKTLYFEDLANSEIGNLGDAKRNVPSDLCYLIYTSGTTGHPKGVMVEHRNLVSLFMHEEPPFLFDSTDVWTMFHSPSFDFSVWEIYGALFHGGRVVIIPRMLAMDTPEYLKLLKKEKVTVLNQTPSAFYKLAELERLESGKDLALKWVIFGGEALSPKKLENWKTKYPEMKLINSYGITETTVFVTFKEIKEEEIEKGLSNIGKPMPTMSCYILNESGKLLPQGVAGELYVGGTGVARGYLNKEELTASRFIENPYNKEERLYRSGDLVRLLTNGELEYLGRIDNQVQLRGFRIELSEIEHQMREYEGIREAVVLLKEKNEEQYLVGYYVSAKEEKIIDLRTHLGTALPEYMIPTYFVQIENLPLTTNGKLDHKALPNAEIKKEENYVAPATEVEEQLVGIWSEVLEVEKEKIGIHDNFFEIGGHSLKVIKMNKMINEAFDAQISVANIFRLNTIKAMADFILNGNQKIDQMEKDLDDREESLNMIREL